jgi:hypothetical protein
MPNEKRPTAIWPSMGIWARPFDLSSAVTGSAASMSLGPRTSRASLNSLSSTKKQQPKRVQSVIQPNRLIKPLPTNNSNQQSPPTVSLESPSPTRSVSGLEGDNGRNHSLHLPSSSNTPTTTSIDHLRSYYTNANSLNNKLSSLNALASSQRPQVIFISETWFNNHSCTTLIGYNSFLRKFSAFLVIN